jgi:hypothetical protein
MIIKDRRDREDKQSNRMNGLIHDQVKRREEKGVRGGE